MKKNITRVALVLAIIAVVFAVVAFVLPVPHNGCFWGALVFALVAIVFQGLALWMGFTNGDSPRSRFYGFPIGQIGTMYMVIQLAISLVLIITCKWVPATIALVLCVLALAAASIGLIAADAIREEIERQDVKLHKDVSLMRTLQSQTNTLAGNWSNPAMEKLAEDMRYSDPVSSEKLADVEGELASLVHQLQAAVLDSDEASAVTLCKKASLVLAERNRRCKLNK